MNKVIKITTDNVEVSIVSTSELLRLMDFERSIIDGKKLSLTRGFFGSETRLFCFESEIIEKLRDDLQKEYAKVNELEKELKRIKSKKIIINL